MKNGVLKRSVHLTHRKRRITKRFVVLTAEHCGVDSIATLINSNKIR